MTCTTDTAAEFIHAPGADLDYGFDWKTNGWLATGETIETSTWTATTGITLSRQQNANGVTSVFAAGGSAGYTYTLTNTITTSLGRIDKRAIKLKVQTR